VTPLVAAPGDTNLSDATVVLFCQVILRIYIIYCYLCKYSPM